MLRRHPSTAFGSVHVFPGGVVDAADHDPALDDALPRPRRRRGVGPARRRRAAAAPSGSRPSARPSRRPACCSPARRRASAVRFDGHPDVGGPVRRAPAGAARRRAPAARRARAPRSSCWPSTDVRYFSHWITPEGEPKRFDTRFFLARAPEGQAYAHDDGELIGSEWVRPADALQRHRGRRLRHDRPHHREPPGHRSLRDLRRAAGRPTPPHRLAPTGRSRDQRRRPRGPGAPADRATGWPAR